MARDSRGVWLCGVEIIQVDEVTGTSSSPLHPPEILERAYRDGNAGDLDIQGFCSQLGVRRNALQTLDDIEIPQLSRYQASLATAKQCRDRALGAEKRVL